MGELGKYVLAFALIQAVYTVILAILSTRTRNPDRAARLYMSATHGVWATSAMILLACVMISFAFYVNDLSLAYVAGHSSRDLPRAYAVTALWSGMEGSLTFWSLVLAGYTSVVAWIHRDQNRDLMPWVITFLMFTQAFFLVVQVFLASPFEVIAFPPVDGRGLNPQLQNPGMVIHPPVLYLGYVGCAVPFAWAMAALVTGCLDDRWIKITRRWLLTAWAFLGVGILLGGAWAYVELGWGGYWAWDPVENASFMPWLAATAFLHSVMIQEKRGMLKVWNLLLVFLTFFLSILGTFLTRSGLVQSVHVFAESSLGWWFLGFLIIVLLMFLGLFIPRLSMLKSENTFDSLLSREAAFLFQNWLFLLMTFVVLLGTLGEPISKAITGVATTFRSPYFNALSIPLGLGILFLTGVGPVIAWRQATPANIQRMFWVPAVVGILSAVAVAAVGMAMGFVSLGRTAHLYALLTFGLCGFVLATIVGEFWRGALARNRTMGEGILPALWAMSIRNRRRYGGYVVHVAAVMIFAGIAGSAFNSEGQTSLRQGEAMAIDGYVVHYVGGEDVGRPNSSGFRARLELFRGETYLGAYGPQKRFYFREEQTTSEVAIHAGFWEDVYAVVNSIEDDGTIVLKVFVNPLVSWIWVGGLLLALGTLFSAWPSPQERRVAVLELPPGLATARG